MRVLRSPVMRPSLVLAFLLGGCAAAPPLPLVEQAVLHDIAGRYRAFFPAEGDPDVARDAGLLRPRFGLPAIVQAGAPIAITTLERGGPAPIRAALLQRSLPEESAARCLDGATVAGCHLLSLDLLSRTPVADDVVVAKWSARPEGTPGLGAWDLYVTSEVDAPVRMPKTVWLRDVDPAAPAPLRVAELADLHVGRGDAALTESHLREVITEINVERPDLVVVAGDLMNIGTDPKLCARARELLLTLESPVAVVMGNHDHGFGKVMHTREYGIGWESFGRAFHPSLLFEITLGGWDFIGFDSGPSSLSPRILTRGVAPETVEVVRAAIADSRAAGHRGVVLFSHTPTRAVLSDKARSGSHGYFGQMREGGAALESVLLEAAASGQRVIHLAGHTHWSDVFEADRHGARLAFERWPAGDLKPSFTPIHSHAALITVQSASVAGMPVKPSARGYGFAWLRLGDGDPEVAFQRHGVDGPLRSLPVAAATLEAKGASQDNERDGHVDCDEDGAGSE